MITICRHNAYRFSNNTPDSEQHGQGNLKS